MLIKHPDPKRSAAEGVTTTDPMALVALLKDGPVEACAHALGQWPTLPPDGRRMAFERLRGSSDARLQQILLNHLVPDLQSDEVAPLLSLLEAEQASLRNQVIDALSQVTSAQTRDTLTTAVMQRLDSKDADLRILTLNLVALLEWPALLPQVEHILYHETDVNVVMTALEAILALGTDLQWPAVAQLTERFPDEPFVSFGVDRARQALLGDN